MSSKSVYTLSADWGYCDIVRCKDTKHSMDRAHLADMMTVARRHKHLDLIILHTYEQPVSYW